MLIGFQGETDRYAKCLEETTLIILDNSGEGLGLTAHIVYIAGQCLHISPQNPSGDSYHAGNEDQNALEKNHCAWEFRLKMNKNDLRVEVYLQVIMRRVDCCNNSEEMDFASHLYATENYTANKIEQKTRKLAQHQEIRNAFVSENVYHQYMSGNPEYFLGLTSSSECLTKIETMECLYANLTNLFAF
jgi:hypothetical protein